MKILAQKIIVLVSSDFLIIVGEIRHYVLRGYHFYMKWKLGSEFKMYT